jgi:hypothetical protein
VCVGVDPRGALLLLPGPFSTFLRRVLPQASNRRRLQERALGEQMLPLRGSGEVTRQDQLALEGLHQRRLAVVQSAARDIQNATAGVVGDVAAAALRTAVPGEATSVLSVSAPAIGAPSCCCCCCAPVAWLLFVLDLVHLPLRTNTCTEL